MGGIQVEVSDMLHCEIFFYILILAYKSTTDHVSRIGSGSMIMCIVSRKFYSDNMDIVEIEH
jgi:hypothetical protein